MSIGHCSPLTSVPEVTDRGRGLPGKGPPQAAPGGVRRGAGRSMRPYGGRTQGVRTVSPCTATTSARLCFKAFR